MSIYFQSIKNRFAKELRAMQPVSEGWVTGGGPDRMLYRMMVDARTARRAKAAKKKGRRKP